jgi:hypothetical protein
MRMDFNSLFEMCLLLRGDKAKNDTTFHHYSPLFNMRKEHERLELEKDLPPIVGLKSPVAIMKQMKIALENTLPFSFVLKENVHWMTNKGPEDEEDEIFHVNLNKEANIICYTIKPNNDIEKEKYPLGEAYYGYNLLLYMPLLKICYVLNHIDDSLFKDSTVRELINDTTNSVLIQRIFQFNNTCVVNIELDILRVILAIMRGDYQSFIMKADTESIEYMDGILPTLLKNEFDIAKSLIIAKDTKLPNSYMTKLVRINDYICYFMSQIRPLWWTTNRNDTYLPLTLLFNYEIKMQTLQRLSIKQYDNTYMSLVEPTKEVIDNEETYWTSLVSDDLLSLPLTSKLTNYSEDTLISENVNHPYIADDDNYINKMNEYEECRKIMDQECTILNPIMNEDFVERSKKPLEVQERITKSRTRSFVDQSQKKTPDTRKRSGTTTKSIY